jgi:tetratricopeptide (TPR) repeat protein
MNDQFYRFQRFFYPWSRLEKVIKALLFSALITCANFASTQTTPTPDPNKKTVSVHIVNSTHKNGDTGTQHEAALVNTTLTKEIVYKVIASEIAVQRGLWKSAFLTLIGLARQTGDERFAQRATEIALAFHSIDDALSATRLWLDTEPSSETARQYWYAILISKNQTDELALHFNQLLKVSSQEKFNALVFQAQKLLMRSRTPKTSYLTLQALLTPYSDRLAPLIALANASFAIDLIEQSQHYAERALKVDPSSELAMLSLAQSLSDQNAMERLAQFLHTYPKSIETRLAYVNFLIDQQQFEIALFNIEELNRHHPQQIQFIYPLANLHFQLEHDEAAKIAYLDFIKLSKGDLKIDVTPALLRLMHLALKKNELTQAQVWLEQIPTLKDQHSHYLAWKLQQAMLLSALDQIDSAIELLDDTIYHNSDEKIQIIIAQSQILKNKNRLSKAFERLQIANTSYPKSILILQEYNRIAELLGLFDEAKSSHLELIRLQPENALAYNALASFLINHNVEFLHAQTLLTKAVELTPKNPLLLNKLGWLQLRQGQLLEAEKNLKMAYELHPSPNNAAHYGELLWLQGRQQQALNVWSQSQQNHPNHSVLQETKLRLTTMKTP